MKKKLVKVFTNYIAQAIDDFWAEELKKATNNTKPITYIDNACLIQADNFVIKFELENCAPVNDTLNKLEEEHLKSTGFHPKLEDLEAFAKYCVRVSMLEKDRNDGYYMLNLPRRVSLYILSHIKIPDILAGLGWTNYDCIYNVRGPVLPQFNRSKQEQDRMNDAGRTKVEHGKKPWENINSELEKISFLEEKGPCKKSASFLREEWWDKMLGSRARVRICRF